MGGFSSHQGFNKEQWREIARGILRNKRTGQEIQKFTLILDSEEQQEDYTYDFQLRRSSETPFVRVLNFEVEKEFCGGYNAYVYTERIYRVNQLQLSVPQAVYMLQQAILAFSVLFDQFGPFNIYPDMLGVNRQGKVKVWISDNFAENELNDATQPIGFKTQQDVIVELAFMIDQQLDDDYLGEILQPYEGSLNFQNTLKILEAYQARSPVRVQKIYLNPNEYADFLNKNASANSKAKTVTTTTTTTTHTQVIQQPVAVPQPQVAYVAPAPTFNPIPLQVVPTETFIPYQPVINYSTSYNIIPTQPPPQPPIEIPVAFIPYQKMHANQARQPRRAQQPQVKVVNRPEYMRQIRAPAQRPDLRRIMPTTEKNQNQKRLQHQFRNNFNQIPSVDSQLVLLPNGNTPAPNHPNHQARGFGIDRRNVNLTDSMVMQNLKPLY